MSDTDKLELGNKRAFDLGLKSRPANYLDQIRPCYYADDIYKLFGDGVRLTSPNFSVSTRKAIWTEVQDEVDEREGFIIGIRPIVQESEERKLLRELVEDWERHFQNRSQNPEIINRAKLHERAKRLLESK